MIPISTSTAPKAWGVMMRCMASPWMSIWFMVRVGFSLRNCAGESRLRPWMWSVPYPHNIMMGMMRKRSSVHGRRMLMKPRRLSSAMMPTAAKP